MSRDDAVSTSNLYNKFLTRGFIMKNRYQMEEIVLCTYAAWFDEKDFGGIDKIYNLYSPPKRSLASIKMKISNIASMLDQEGIERHNNVPSLAGTINSEPGRKTDWPVVELLIKKTKEELLALCKNIIDKKQLNVQE